MKESKIKMVFKNANSKFFLIISIVMIISIGIVGVLLTAHSVSNLKKEIWSNMESVATTAATLIDGDELELITEEDVPVLDSETGARLSDGSERFKRIEHILLSVKQSQKDMYIPYIYITRLENGHQVFVIDTDIVSPGEYGEEVVYTPSQPIAWAGTPMVDDDPYSDEWGSYYTAWSPIIDSDGHVVGLVGVDFEASQIADQLNFSMILIIATTIFLLVLCITFVVLYSRKVKKDTNRLRGEINDLSDNLKTMFDEIEGIEQTDIHTEPNNNSDGQDFMKYIHNKTIDMTQRLRKHTEYMEHQANIDFLTKTGNTRAYSAEKSAILDSIAKGNADFAVGVFDINGLKIINDNLGHECGDEIIVAAAEAIKKVFPANSVFRIGGDEFAVIVRNTTAKSMDLQFGLIDVEIEQANKSLDNSLTLALAKGYTIFDKNTDKTFKDVFARADKNMYIDKKQYHVLHDTEECEQ